MKTQEQFQRDFALQVKGVAESIEEAACEDYDGLAEYFDDCLDVDFIVSGRLEYRGAVDAVDEYFEEQFNCLRESY